MSADQDSGAPNHGAEKAIMDLLLAAPGRMLRKEISRGLAVNCTEYTITQALNRLVHIGLLGDAGSTLKRVFWATDLAYQRFGATRPVAAVTGPASLEDAVVAILTNEPQMLNTIVEKIRPRTQSQKAKDALRRLSRECKAKYIDGRGWIAVVTHA